MTSTDIFVFYIFLIKNVPKFGTIKKERDMNITGIARENFEEAGLPLKNTIELTTKNNNKNSVIIYTV